MGLQVGLPSMYHLHPPDGAPDCVTSSLVILTVHPLARSGGWRLALSLPCQLTLSQPRRDYETRPAIKLSLYTDYSSVIINIESCQVHSSGQSGERNAEVSVTITDLCNTEDNESTALLIRHPNAHKRTYTQIMTVGWSK